MVNSESRASACATSIAALFMSANAPRFDAVAANAILGFTDVSEKPSFFFTAPARNPRTLCCCQSVARIISAMLAPSGWLSRVSTRSCFGNRSTVGSSAFTGVLSAATRSAFDSTDRSGFLAVAAVDGTLRRDDVFDLALPFLGAVLRRLQLEALARSTKTDCRLRQRAWIVLGAAEGVASRAIGREVGCTTGTASKWRVRYAANRLAGLDETGNRGAEPKYTAETDKRILAVLDGPVPAGYARWTGPLIAAALGDVDVQYVWRFLRAHKIDLSARKSWCESNDPDFAAKAAEIVGLYLAPPENAIVICVDEQPSIQALERAQGYLKFPNGRALSGQSHDYKRHGTSTLFAALEVATGKVITAHKRRRRRIEFLDVMNEIAAAYPDTVIHAVLDNLNTHKPKNDRWLKRHPNVHFHFTPTRASWLNQVENWFSILQGNSLKDASFTSVKQLREHIDAFIEAYNENAKAFAWTKSQVYQKRLKARFADQ